MASWKRCSVCKKDIALGQTYWVCNVSTCNRKRTALAFCTTECWDAHLGFVNHRESWAIEKQAPLHPPVEAPTPVAPERPRRRILTGDSEAPRASSLDIASSGHAAVERGGDVPREILIIASKLKDYIRARSGLNTSDRVMGVISDAVRKLADGAIDNAVRSERKTVLDRDFTSRS